MQTVEFLVRDSSEGYKVVGTATRAPRFHTGWESVTYKGRRYQLLGGIRTPLFINIMHPIKGEVNMPAGTFNTPEYKAELVAQRRRMQLSLDAQKEQHARAFILNVLSEGISTGDLERILAVYPNTLRNTAKQAKGQ